MAKMRSGPSAEVIKFKAISDVFTLSFFKVENLQADKRQEVSMLKSTLILQMYELSKTRKYKTGSRKQEVK